MMLRFTAAGLLLLVAFLGRPGPIYAQFVLRGVVSDEGTGEPLPSATLQIEGTYDGTITNAEGAYILEVPERPAVLVVRYIGFDIRRIAVDAATPQRLDIALTPSVVQMEELVVSDEDPAYSIMRRVIERKQRWQAELETYQVEAYNRFTLQNDTGIVSIMESLTTTFWDRERGIREIVLASRKTTNMDFDEVLPAARFVLNLYDDDVEVSGYRLMGVTHPDALDHYRFRLVGTRSIGEQIVYDIEVQPRSRLKSAFVGRVAVLDGEFALLEVRLRPSEAFLFPPPIQRYDVEYTQQFSNFGREAWLPVDFRSSVDLRISFGALFSLPDIHVDQASRLSGYRLGAPVPDSLYEASEDETLEAPDSLAADSLLDREGVAVPLEAAEIAAYATIDSTDTLEKVFKPRGAVGRMAEMSDDEDNGRGGRFDLPFDLEPEFWYNRVEGWHLGTRVSKTLADRFTLSAEGAYLTGMPDADRLAYGGSASLRLGPSRRGTFTLRYRSDVPSRYTAPAYPMLFNSLSVLLGGDDYYDYYRREGVSAGLSYRVRPLRSTVSVAYLDERHKGITKGTDYDLVGRVVPLPENPLIEAGRLRAWRARLVVGDDGDALGFGLGGARRLDVQVERSDPSLFPTDYAYTKYQARLDWRFTTLFRRRFIPNTLDVSLTAGTSDGRLPLQRIGTLDGTLGFFSPFGVFRTIQGRPYEGNRYLAFFWEHHFRTVPFEAVGLRGVARKGIGLIVHGGHGRTWGGPDLTGYAPRRSEGVHHEVGVSLTGLFSLFRVDVSFRLDEPGFGIGLGAARFF